MYIIYVINTQNGIFNNNKVKNQTAQINLQDVYFEQYINLFR